MLKFLKLFTSLLFKTLKSYNFGNINRLNK